MSENRAHLGDGATLVDDRRRATGAANGDIWPKADLSRPSSAGPSTSAAWSDDFAWLNQALRLAFRPRALFFAAVGWLAVSAGWWMCGSVFTQFLSPAAGSHLAHSIAEFGRLPWSQPLPLSGWAEVDMTTPAGLVWWWQQSPLVDGYLRLAAPFVGLFNPRITSAEFLFLLVCGFWELMVWSFFGGLITRLAAVELAGEKSPSWSSLVGYTRRRWSLYFAAPLFALGGGACLGIPLALAGLLLHTEMGLLVVAACWILPLLAGLIMAEVLVGLFFGFPLMWATISSEGTDAFDALSRCFGYTYQRPVSYFLYSIVSAALGILGWAVVAIFIAAIVTLAAWGVSWSSAGAIAPEALLGAAWSGWPFGGAAAADLSGAAVTGPTGELALRLVRLWIDLAAAVGMAFGLSYFWTATTAIYFLLRRGADGIALHKVYLPGTKDRAAPALGRDVAEDNGHDEAAARDGSPSAGPQAPSVPSS